MKSQREYILEEESDQEYVTDSEDEQGGSKKSRKFTKVLDDGDKEIYIER